MEAKLTRLLEWVGVWIPDEVVLDGKKLPLHQVIWNIVRKDKLADDELELLLSLEKKLGEKYALDIEKIEHEDTGEDQAADDFCEAVGLLRALVDLKDVERREEKKEQRGDVNLKMRENSKDQARQWLDFLNSFGAL